MFFLVAQLINQITHHFPFLSLWRPTWAWERTTVWRTHC